MVFLGEYMKSYLATSLLIGALSVSLSAGAEHHEEKPAALPYALWSTYEIAPGQTPAEVQASLETYLKAEETRGFDNCVMYRHEIGSERSFYTACTFKDMHHFAKINDSAPPAASSERQLFAAHMDHVVMMTKLGMKTLPNYLMFATTTFSSDLSVAEQQANAEDFYSIYGDAFGGCNQYQHLWGPELAYYAICGFDNYKALANATDVILGEKAKKIMTTHFHITTHRDDILVKVMD